MGQASYYCSCCGAEYDHIDQLCRICGSPLDMRIVQNPSMKRRGLIGCLALGGVILTGLGSCAGIARMVGIGPWSAPPSAPAKLPVDTHRMLNLPLKLLPGDYAWLPDNTQILGFDYQTLFLLDVKSGKKVWVQQNSFGPQGTIRRIHWSLDRRYVAEIGEANLGGDNDFRAVVWDMQSRQRIWQSPRLGHIGNTVYPGALAPNGATFTLCHDNTDIDIGATTTDTTVEIWDIQKNHLTKAWNVQDTPLPIPQGQTEDFAFAVTTLVWSPDNTHMASIHAGGSIQVWDGTKGSLLWMYNIPNGRGISLQWSPDGTTLVAWGYPERNQIQILDAHTGKLLFQIANVNISYDEIIMGSYFMDPYIQKSRPIIWSRDNTRMAMLTGWSDIHVCDARTGQQLFTCQHVEGKLTGCSWSPDGRYLAAGNMIGRLGQSEDNGAGSTIQFWDAQSGKALFIYQVPRAPSQLAWSPDSHLLAAYTPQSFESEGLHLILKNFALQVFQVV